MTIWIAPYKVGSKSARLLAEELQCKRIKIRNSRFTEQQDKFTINWGRSDAPFDVHLNEPSQVACATNKVSARDLFECHGVPTFELFQFRQNAQYYLDVDTNGDSAVLGRMNGLSGGDGIDIYRAGETIPHEYHFYSVLVPSDTEYRVHIVRRKLIGLTQKRQRRGMKEWWDDDKRIIRCHENNWIHSKSNVVFNEHVTAVARDAVDALGLDFGAVDVLWCEERGATVLEVNTAPGIEGSLVTAYANAFENIYNDR